jgi:RNA polymerase sigma factor (sigma-70 family)
MGEMHDQSDARLLRDYAERSAEAAFAEIVARHTDFVYSAALRQVYSPDLARDVTQSVFTDLARKARTISVNMSPEASLVGWLYRGTRFAARDLNRTEIRRTQRERQAMEQLQPAPETPPDWEQLRPVLDDAMSELDDTDRDAVLLRYFKNHDLRTVGAILGISDDAAQKRVSRAVERLREFFAKRGVTIGASGLGVIISANAVQAAPVGLALTISTAVAVAGTAVVTTATATATKAIAMTTLQKAIIGTTLAVAVGTGIYEARQASVLRSQVQTLRQQHAPLSERIQRMQQERDEATNQIARLNEAISKNQKDNLELLRLRGEVGQLRRQLLETAAKTNATPPRIEFGLPYSRRDEWAEEGTGEPMNTVLTMLWATKLNNEARLAQLVHPGITNQPIDQLTIPMRDRATMVGVQIVTVDVTQFFHSGLLQDVAQVQAILQVKVPVLGKEIMDNRMRRWSLSKTNGEWLITSGR